MFTPPRCPYPPCRAHSSPTPGFFVRNGFYRAKCRPHPVPRFACNECGRGFSRQTFRMDYRDHKPHLNPQLFLLLASGIGLRQSSRVMHLSLRCTELKFRKLATHFGHLNLNLRAPLPEGASFQLDELETFEGRRNTRPLTVAVLIEKMSWYVVWMESAPIRPRGRMTDARRRAIEEDEKRHGKRRDGSRRAIVHTLTRGARIARGLERVLLESDEKSTYPPLAKRLFGAERLVHERTNSKLPRMPWNPLFAINNTEALARDLTGRLRRESWLVSKLGCCLDLGLQIFRAYRNFVRPRFNGELESPAQILGIVKRRMRPTELLSWRQDWRGRSIHPLSRRLRSVSALAA